MTLNKQALRVPERKRHNWRQAVMRDCDFCSQWSLTVKHENGGQICASCCDAEYTSELKCALEVAIERADAAENLLEEQRSAIIAPGIMRCAGCGFVLTKNSINMAAGTITAGDSKTEPCPNGCGPLWPVTWKEQALQMRDDSEQWFEELQEARNRIAELEAREVILPVTIEAHPFGPQLTKMLLELHRNTVNECANAIRAAGIKIKGE